MSNLPNPGLFPSIGAVASETEKLQEPPEKSVIDAELDVPADDEDRPVQEVESLCMNCEKQVSITRSFSMTFSSNIIFLSIGSNEATAYIYSLLSRSYCDVI